MELIGQKPLTGDCDSLIIMRARSIWKGHLRLALIVCPVALYKGTSEPEHRSFAWINKNTGNKVNQERVDSVTGDNVPFEDIAKGIDIGGGKFITITDDEIASAEPRSATIIDIVEFVSPSQIPRGYVDGHCFLGPQGDGAEEAFALIRTAIARERVAAIGQITLGTHERLAAFLPCGKGLAVTLLRYAAELRDPIPMFAHIGDGKPLADLVDLAAGLVSSMTKDEFEPDRFADRYALGLDKVVRDKIAGTMIKPATPPATPKMANLGDALRRSVEGRGARRRPAGAETRKRA